MKNTNNDGLLFLGRINEKDKNKPKPGSWSWVSCKNSYCLFAPPFTINGKEISPKKIKDASFTEELNKHIISHSKELPDFSWQLSEDNKVCINNKWKFVETILKFAKRKEKSVKTSKESRPKSKLDFMNQSRPGDWSWVQFFDGCCTFSPSHLIFGDKIIPQYINLPGSTKKINKYIGKHAKQGGSELPSFTYHINEHNEAVVDKIKVFSEIVSKFKKTENRKLEKLPPARYELQWSQVTKLNNYYVFQPSNESVKVKSLKIMINNSSLPSVAQLMMYGNELPAIKYALYQKRIVNFDIESFNRAIVKCKALLKGKRPRVHIKMDADNHSLKEELAKAFQQDHPIEQKTNEVQDCCETTIKQECPVKQKNKLERLSLIERLLNEGVDMEIFNKAFVLQWSDVKFYHKYFVFTPKIKENIGRNKIAPLRVDNYKCQVSFNYILTYFQSYLPQITYHITENFEIKFDDEPAFENALADLVQEKMRYDIEIIQKRTDGSTQYRLGFNAAMARAEKMKPEDFKKYKSRFVDFLVEHQSKEHKIVPVSEDFTYANGSRFSEEGFIFTTKSYSSRLLVVVMENVNPDRATMYFVVRTGMYKTALHTIFDYIQSDRKNKRSAIRDGKVPLEDVGVSYYGTTHHDYFYDWKNRLQRYIR